MQQAPTALASPGGAVDPGLVFRDQRGPVVALEAAVHQVHDPLRIDLQGCRFLPEPLAAGAIGPLELGFDQLLASSNTSACCLRALNAALVTPERQA
jgi:hypothetical protein